MADSNLAAIRKKVRRLTRSPSPSQITNDQINEYINTFVLYDMPAHLRLFSNKTKFTFYTEPYIDEYNSDNPAIELNNFKNLYKTFNGPVYIGGDLKSFYLNREDFFAVYPKTTPLNFITNGDGVTTNFTGTLPSIPVTQGNNLFSSIDSNNNSLALYDNTVLSDTIGTLGGTGTGTINYVTGAYDITFSSAPAADTAINSQSLVYRPTIPQAILFFDNKFIVRPIPDQAYRVELEAFKRPEEMFAGSEPGLEGWYQYIAYGAAIKIYQDKMDVESVAILMPEFKQQEILVNRDSEDQKARGKVKTIFNSGGILRRSPFYRW